MEAVGIATTRLRVQCLCLLLLSSVYRFFFRAGSATSSSGELLRIWDFGITCLDQLVWLFFVDVL